VSYQDLTIFTWSNNSTFRKGTVKSVVVTEDKRGRHVMTHVVGLEHFGLDPKEVAKACSKKFAVSATTAKLPGKGTI
jgi:translation initiation factor 1 (eIF-1/SUI1)